MTQLGERDSGCSCYRGWGATN